MTKQEILDRIDILWEEVQANNDENYHLENEIEELENQLEEMEDE